MERDLTYNAPKIKFTDTEGQEEHFYFNRSNNSTNDLTSHDSSSTQLQDANSEDKPHHHHHIIHFLTIPMKIVLNHYINQKQDFINHYFIMIVIIAIAA